MEELEQFLRDADLRFRELVKEGLGTIERGSTVGHVTRQVELAYEGQRELRIALIGLAGATYGMEPTKRAVKRIWGVHVDFCKKWGFVTYYDDKPGILRLLKNGLRNMCPI